MTDYDFWSNFKLDQALDETDSRLSAEDFRDSQKRTFRDSAQAWKDTNSEAHDLSEVLRAQVTIEKLKNAETGNMSAKERRRMKKLAMDSNAKQPIDTSTTVLPSDTALKASDDLRMPSDKEAATIQNAMSTEIMNSSVQGKEKEPSSKVIIEFSMAMDAASSAFATLLSLVDQINLGPSQFSDSDTQRHYKYCQIGLTLLHKTNHFTSNELKIARDMETEVLKSGLKVEVKSSFTVLNKMKEGVKSLVLQAVTQTALHALRSKQYALATDITRFWLKKLEQEKAKEGKNELLEAMMSSQDETSQSQGSLKDKEGLIRANQSVAMIWMIRCFAFLGLGQCYMANVHARQVKRVYAAYPNIQHVLSYLDTLEADSMYYLRKVSDTSLINIEMKDAYQLYIFLQHNKMDGIDIFDVRKDKSLREFKSVPVSDKEEEDKDNGKEATMSEQEEARRETELHMSEISVSIPREYTSSSSMKEQEVEYGDTSPFMEEWQGNIDISVLLRVIHECYYRAQMLYLENLYRSAEVKYTVTTLLINICYAVSKMKKSSEEEKYDCLLTVQSACLVNIATCRVLRAQFNKTMKGQVYDPLGSEITTLRRNVLPSLDDVTEESLLLECNADLLISSPPPVIAYVALLQRKTLHGYMRAVFISETMHRYDEGITIIDNDILGVDFIASMKDGNPNVEISGKLMEVLRESDSCVLENSQSHLYSQLHLPSLCDGRTDKSDTHGEEVVTDIVLMNVIQQKIMDIRTRLAFKKNRTPVGK